MAQDDDRLKGELQLAFERRRLEFLKEIMADYKARRADEEAEECVLRLQAAVEATAARIAQFSGRSDGQSRTID